MLKVHSLSTSGSPSRRSVDHAWHLPRGRQGIYELLSEGHEGGLRLRVERFRDKGFAAVAQFHNSRIHRDAPEEGNSQLRSRLLATPYFEQLDLASAVRADHATHILHDAEYRDVQEFAEAHRLSGIKQGNVLGG